MAVKDWWEDFYADDCLKIGSWEDMTNHIQRTATIVVAANDSDKKRGADYVCDGVADQVQINQAIAALPETVVVWDNCDSSAASWTAVQGDETLSDDGVDYEEGTGSLKCLGGTNNDPGIKKVGLGSLDWSGYNLIRFYFKQNTANIEHTCWLFFYDSSANWERYDFNGRSIWQQHSISIGEHPDATSGAALDWTDIVEIRIQVETEDDAYTFRVDDIRLVDRIGGKVVLMEGNYIIDDKIIGDANTVLAGFGDGSYIFVADGTNIYDSFDKSHIIFEDCDNVTVKDLRINLNGSNLGGTGDKNGIRLFHVYKGIMSNIHAYNLRLGGNVLDTVYSETAEISHCHVEDYDDYGIAISKCVNCHAHDNTVIGSSGNEAWGIVITQGYYPGAHRSDYCSITNNLIEGTDNAAILIRQSYGCNVSGNNCHHFLARGIDITGSQNIDVSDNVLDGNGVGWCGIRTLKYFTNVCGWVNITGNVIRRCEKVGSDAARGVIIEEAKYSSVVGNTISQIDYDDDGAGIELLSSYVVVSGNMITTVHDGILMKSFNNITGNQLYSLSGNGIDECSTGSSSNSISGNMLSSITGTEIISTTGNNYCCVGNWLLGGIINLAGVSNTIANNET